jgi:hypothetical protein
MTPERWNDLYDRLTSRKLLLCIVTIILAIFLYHTGDLTAVQLQQAVLVAVGVYTTAEGATDAIGAWRSTPTQLATAMRNLSPEQRDELFFQLEGSREVPKPPTVETRTPAPV